MKNKNEFHVRWYIWRQGESAIDMKKWKKKKPQNQQPKPHQTKWKQKPIPAKNDYNL